MHAVATMRIGCLSPRRSIRAAISGGAPITRPNASIAIIPARIVRLRIANVPRVAQDSGNGRSFPCAFNRRTDCTTSAAEQMVMPHARSCGKNVGGSPKYMPSWVLWGMTTKTRASPVTVRTIPL